MSLSGKAARVDDIETPSNGNGNGNAGGIEAFAATPEVEYVTGYRFVAVGVAIVMSMFLVPIPNLPPGRGSREQRLTEGHLGFPRLGEMR